MTVPRLAPDSNLKEQVLRMAALGKPQGNGVAARRSAARAPRFEAESGVCMSHRISAQDAARWAMEGGPRPRDGVDVALTERVDNEDPNFQTFLP